MQLPRSPSTPLPRWPPSCSAVQFAAPKGTPPHWTLGWVWVVLMLVISGSSFLIHGIRMWGPWSPIHLLSVFTPIMLVIAVLAARAHRVRAHKITMMSLFAGALVPRGVFTLVPGRIMHTVLFGS